MPDSVEAGVIPIPRLFDWSSPDGESVDCTLHDPSEIAVWLITLDGEDAIDDSSCNSTLETLYGEILSSEELARAKRLIKPRDRHRFARCRSSLRRILGGIQEVSAAEVRFASGPFGKPYLLEPGDGGARSSIEFNVSHSGGLALVAACLGRPIGIDLEQVREIREAERIVASFFTDDEQAEFARVPEADRDFAFMRGWTRKEAILKGIGKGLAGGPTNFETQFGASVLGRAFQAISPAPRITDWMFWEAAIAEGYVATLAAAVPRRGLGANDDVIA